MDLDDLLLKDMEIFDVQRNAGELFDNVVNTGVFLLDGKILLGGTTSGGVVTDPSAYRAVYTPPATIDPNDVDDDHDGFTENQGDFNDNNPTIYPGASEICGDGIDQDCDGKDLACPLKGDFNGDGVVNSVDTSFTLNAYYKKIPSLPIYDMNNDGKVNLVDAAIHKTYYTK
jgi:hypothetical protein